MLGRLLNTAASNLNPAAYTSRKSTSLESVTEEEHTAGLLFPDVNVLRRSHTHAYPLRSNSVSPNTPITGGFDDHGGLDLDQSKDFRVIVAQNALGDRDEPCILLDTNAPSQPQQGLGMEQQGFGGSQGRHSRNSSISKPPPRRGSAQGVQSSLPDSNFVSSAANARKPNPIGGGAFSHARHRSSTLSLASGDGEPHQSRLTADSNELGLLNCIFGSSAFSYRESSTKMHILSADNEPQPTAASSASAMGRETNHFGSRGFQNRTPHTRTFSTDPRATSSSLSQENLRSINGSKSPTKFTVLVTRMFSVNLPESRDASIDGSEQESPHDPSFPFPEFGKRRKIKEKKTPMYAVAIVIQVPLVARGNIRPMSQLGSRGPDFLRPDGSMSFSLDSGQRWSGALLDDGPSSLSPGSNLDDRIDLLVDHWDVITRTLSHLEKLASREILVTLKKVDFFAGQQPKPAKPPNMQRTNQTIVQLPPNMLAGKSWLRDEALASIQRIQSALRIPRVITGQNRWGIWREEARWISRYLGEKEHGFFFLVLLTAFLGNHTEWLCSLGPKWYRRRRHLQQKAHQEDENTISNRTVIISPDKMIARRLIFLLSTFLPPKQRTEAFASPLRPGTSASARPLSQSPPNATISRQESLRRTINRRARATKLNLEESANQDKDKPLSTSCNEASAQPPDEAEFMKTADYSNSRRNSDVRSIRTASLPVPTNEVLTQKSGAATTSTATPSTTTPVPHFSSQQSNAVEGTSNQTTLERTESLASANLMQTLKRSESSNISPDGSELHHTSRWGSILSGFWSSRQESSTDSSQTHPPSQETSYKTAAESESAPRGPRKLEQMVVETRNAEPEQPKDIKTSDNISIPLSSAPKPDVPGSLETPPEQPSDNEYQTRESPVKLSVRGNDGVVDVDLPLPGFVSLSSSGESVLASPKRARTSMTSLDAAGSIHSNNSGLNPCPKDNDGPSSNVSGFLKQFHEDFVLQTVRPYTTLEPDIKRSMSAETSPSHSGSSPGNDTSGKWVDVCTTLVADVRTFTVKRIRLRRKITPREPSPSTAESPTESLPVTPRQEQSPAAFQFSSIFNMARSRKNSISTLIESLKTDEVEEKFIEEPVTELDDILVDAVERVLARSGQSSLAPSRAPSPSRGRRATGDNSDQKGEDSTRDEIPFIGVSRTDCRRLILGALEEVVRSVTAERAAEESNTETNRRTNRDSKRRSADNILREGVRKWLLDIEESC